MLTTRTISAWCGSNGTPQTHETQAQPQYCSENEHIRTYHWHADHAEHQAPCSETEQTFQTLRQTRNPPESDSGSRRLDPSRDARSIRGRLECVFGYP